MSLSVYVDASAFVAVFFERDQRHEEAKAALADLRSSKRRLVTASDVFDETVTALRRWAGYERAVMAGEMLRTSVLVDIVSLDDDLRETGWRLFRKHRLPGLSLTDCTSFATMQLLRVRQAFTFDDDFRKAGFSALP